MIDLSDNPAKTRVSLTLTGVYVEALDRLVEEGLYVDRREVIKDALRRLFRHYEIKSFVKPLEETNGE